MGETTHVPEQIAALLTEKWKRGFVVEKRTWDADPGWPAKLVKTEFTLAGKSYVIGPEDIGLTSNCWDQGFMEHIQGRMKDDLASCGATDVTSSGFID